MNRSTAPTFQTQEAEPHIPTSVILERLIRDAPTDQVTLAWLLGHLRARSFGIILLLLGICGLLPVVSPVAGVMLGVPAFQMMRAHPVPVFPRRLAERPVPTVQLAAMVERIIPALRYLERFIRPRWATPFQTTKRVIGGFVLLLGLCLLTPIPLSNVPVGLAIVLMAFAYLEEDGMLLMIALIIAVGLLATATATLWTTAATMVWITR
ncbi:MAG TPA: exopolysaccharide biosynthesis protein [Aliidongia sp.]|nr:exopolysaccharide biosynthesis protein [Aliidongia sp.]